MSVCIDALQPRGEGDARSEDQRQQQVMEDPRAQRLPFGLRHPPALIIGDGRQQGLLRHLSHTEGE